MSRRGYPRRRSAIGAGLAGKCPRCARGRLYCGFLKVTGRCAVCGLDLEKADSGDGPAVFIVFLLSVLLVPSALLFEARVAPPLWVHLVLWPPLIMGGALALLRPVKGFVIALRYRQEAGEAGRVEDA